MTSAGSRLVHPNFEQVYVEWPQAPLGWWVLPGDNIFASKLDTLNNVKPVGKLQEDLGKSWASHIVWQEAEHGGAVGAGLGWQPRDCIQSCLVQTDMKSVCSCWLLP